MAPRFISEPIQVEATGTIRQPQSFTWRGEQYRITEIILAWMDWGFPSGSSQKDWRSRRHRNYFRVRTESGEVFELYNERAAAGPTNAWYLYQQLDSTE
jgi:hypothetical protein